LLLRHTFGLRREAELVDDAVRMVLESGLRPADLAWRQPRAASTTEIGDAVVHAVGELIDHRHAYHAV
jgi:hypothetical protein